MSYASKLYPGSPDHLGSKKTKQQQLYWVLIVTAGLLITVRGGRMIGSGIRSLRGAGDQAPAVALAPGATDEQAANATSEPTQAAAASIDAPTTAHANTDESTAVVAPLAPVENPTAAAAEPQSSAVTTRVEAVVIAASPAVDEPLSPAATLVTERDAEAEPSSPVEPAAQPASIPADDRSNLANESPATQSQIAAEASDEQVGAETSTERSDATASSEPVASQSSAEQIVTVTETSVVTEAPDEAAASFPATEDTAEAAPMSNQTPESLDAEPSANNDQPLTEADRERAMAALLQLFGAANEEQDAVQPGIESEQAPVQSAVELTSEVAAEQPQTERIEAESSSVETPHEPAEAVVATDTAELAKPEAALSTAAKSSANVAPVEKQAAIPAESAGTTPAASASEESTAAANAQENSATADADEPVREEAAELMLVLVNPRDGDGTIRYLVNGYSFSMPPGHSQRLPANRPWKIHFHRGGELGNIEMVLQDGVYEFHAGDAGWDLSAVDSAVGEKTQD